MVLTHTSTISMVIRRSTKCFFILFFTQPLLYVRVSSITYHQRVSIKPVGIPYLCHVQEGFFNKIVIIFKVSSSWLSTLRSLSNRYPIISPTSMASIIVQEFHQGHHRHYVLGFVSYLSVMSPHTTPSPLLQGYKNHH